VADLDARKYAIVTVDWGFWSQLYFLSRGEAPLYEWAFRFATATEDEAAAALGTFLLHQQWSGRRVIFLHDDESRLGTAVPTFRAAIARLGGELELWRRYSREEPPEGGWALWTLADPQGIRTALCRDAPRPRILAYGPRETTATGEGLAMWLQLEDAHGEYGVRFGGRTKQPVIDREAGVVTISVDAREIAGPGTILVEVCDLCQARACAEASLRVGSAPGGG
jgi:hypothetical protein